jgi:hypothetical protein
MKRLLTIGLVLGCVVLAVTTMVFAYRARRAELALAQLHAGTEAGTNGGAITVPLLKKLLAERETAYFELKNQYDRLAQTLSAKTGAVAVAAVSTNAPARGGEMSYLERLRTEDPERYKQIMADRERRRQRLTEELNRQLARLDQRLQGATTQAEVDLVTQIADTLTHLNDLRQQWENVRSLPEDQRQAATEALISDTRASYQKLNELRAQDRTLQLQQLASQIGYSDPAGFAAAVQNIINETDANPSRFLNGGRRSGSAATTTR